MANPFNKGWKYLMQSLDTKIDENADPKVQIQQAAAAAKEQHQAITRQAAEIIGNRNQLQMKLNRLVETQADLQDKTKTALQMADKATAEGDTAKAAQFTQTAETFATQLVSTEQELEGLKTQYAAADQAAQQAQEQQRQSEARLHEQLAQVQQLQAQADQARMQEETAKTMDTIGQFRTDDSVPTLDGVREKIERRYANALGQQELAENSVNDRMAEISAGQTDMQATSRLEEIRAAMKAEAAGELTAGSASGAEAGVTAESAAQASAGGEAGPAGGAEAASHEESASHEEAKDVFDDEAPLGAINAEESDLDDK
ncbi:PspA/IM30 family protein [Corynebacterium aquatimens]|uniref:Phage shock protein A n=1 Tax=Corynebacterium aquatimens TaxID=1190508 RepID=A0A931E148_9CORY|nr:PspA/IM30 family protein [Corynebacterium aquatimens]MBG6122794.1 phage shock protein A [Corynebacterium aquatimens]WJY66871.1 PspA/IM30 family protein [Corynebacterium aquatimens]